MNESRCDERLNARVEESTCLTYTGLHDKTKIVLWSFDRMFFFFGLGREGSEYQFPRARNTTDQAVAPS
jgi:hypothetical protein